VPFRNPTTSLPADDVTPGTLTGSTVQTTTAGRRIVMADPGSVQFLAAGGGTISPPEIEFYSGQAGEVYPGLIASFSDNTATPVLPKTIIMSPDIGAGSSYLLLQGGVPSVQNQAFIAAAGNTAVFAGGVYSELQGPGGTRTGVDNTSGYVGNYTRVLSGGTWTGVSYVNGWKDLAGWQAVQVKKLSDGTVMLRGITQPPSGAPNGQTMFNLPAGFAPPTSQVFHGATDGNYNANVFVYSSGAVVMNNASATPGWLSFGGMTWDWTG
jgi:hypothetical protein